jgi:hypothetical protein
LGLLPGGCSTNDGIMAPNVGAMGFNSQTWLVQHPILAPSDDIKVDMTDPIQLLTTQNPGLTARPRTMLGTVLMQRLRVQLADLTPDPSGVMVTFRNPAMAGKIMNSGMSVGQLGTLIEPGLCARDPALPSTFRRSMYRFSKWTSDAQGLLIIFQFTAGMMNPRLDRIIDMRRLMGTLAARLLWHKTPMRHHSSLPTAGSRPPRSPRHIPSSSGSVASTKQHEVANTNMTTSPDPARTTTGLELMASTAVLDEIRVMADAEQAEPADTPTPEEKVGTSDDGSITMECLAAGCERLVGALNACLYKRHNTLEDDCDPDSSVYGLPALDIGHPANLKAWRTLMTHDKTIANHLLVACLASLELTTATATLDRLLVSPLTTDVKACQVTANTNNNINEAIHQQQQEKTWDSGSLEMFRVVAPNSRHILSSSRIDRQTPPEESHASPGFSAEETAESALANRHLCELRWLIALDTLLDAATTHLGSDVMPDILNLTSTDLTACEFRTHVTPTLRGSSELSASTAPVLKEASDSLPIQKPDHLGERDHINTQGKRRDSGKPRKLTGQPGQPGQPGRLDHQLQQLGTPGWCHVADPRSCSSASVRSVWQGTTIVCAGQLVHAGTAMDLIRLVHRMPTSPPLSRIPLPGRIDRRSATERADFVSRVHAGIALGMIQQKDGSRVSVNDTNVVAFPIWSSNFMAPVSSVDRTPAAPAASAARKTDILTFTKARLRHAHPTNGHLEGALVGIWIPSSNELVITFAFGPIVATTQTPYELAAVVKQTLIAWCYVRGIRRIQVIQYGSLSNETILDLQVWWSRVGMVPVPQYEVQGRKATNTGQTGDDNRHWFYMDVPDIAPKIQVKQY